MPSHPRRSPNEQVFPIKTTGHRRYKYAVAFVALGIALLISAYRTSTWIGWLIFAWFATSLLLVGIAYAIKWAGVFGKTATGAVHSILIVIMLPFLLFTWIVWFFQNRFVSASTWNRVTPRIYLGRRCQRTHLPPDISCIVDVTAEFPFPRSVRDGCFVISIPTLDGCPPRWRDCQRVFEFMERNPNAAIYVYCANGHGRSVTLVATLLGLLGEASSVNGALEIIKSARPTISPNSDQRHFLNEAFHHSCS